jgi:hypothetical protein
MTVFRTYYEPDESTVQPHTLILQGTYSTKPTNALCICWFGTVCSLIAMHSMNNVKFSKAPFNIILRYIPYIVFPNGLFLESFLNKITIYVFIIFPCVLHVHPFTLP